MTEELDRRVSSLEQWRTKQETSQAVEAERRKHMDKRFDAMEGRLDKIDGHLSKVVWLIISAIIVGFMGFALSGGLNAVGG
ncbi:hypothetical protein [uncultured Maritalea sp.]|uniref:hypothetical protein n=1 Tax=uncultured Maritalea sp. TaxID=757249 RepID=UPI0026088203|nr:hypothetical protein [uncultured Maritalea sp.]